MLLDFQRSASQVFDPQLSVISDRGLLLGVGDKEVSYMTNEEAEVVAFVREENCGHMYRKVVNLLMYLVLGSRKTAISGMPPQSMG